MARKKLKAEADGTTAPKGGGRGNRAAIHAAARARRQGMYKAHPAIAEVNKAKRVRRHVRSNPHDEVARAWLEKNYAGAANVGLSNKGRRLETRYRVLARAERRRHQQEELGV